MVRASYQTRAFEDRFIKIGMPYKIIGGTKFYERLEIRDALAFLRIVASDYDDLAFERIINVPKKGIGEKTIRSIEVLGREKDLSLIQATRELVKINYFSNNFIENPITFFGFFAGLGLFVCLFLCLCIALALDEIWFWWCFCLGDLPGTCLGLALG